MGDVMRLFDWSKSKLFDKKFKLVSMPMIKPSRWCWLNGPHVEGVAYQWLWFRFEMWLRYNQGFEHMRGHSLTRLSPEVVDSIVKYPPEFSKKKSLTNSQEPVGS